MKQQTHKIDNKEYIFVEVDKTCKNFKKHFNKELSDYVLFFESDYVKNITMDVGKSNINIISTLSNISEEDAEKIVENILFYKEKRFKEYPFEQFPYKRAFESLNSLITSLGLSGEILILEKQ
jgi:hypothetical protein